MNLDYLDYLDSEYDKQIERVEDMLWAAFRPDKSSGDEDVYRAWVQVWRDEDASISAVDLFRDGSDVFGPFTSGRVNMAAAAFLDVQRDVATQTLEWGVTSDLSRELERLTGLTRQLASTGKNPSWKLLTAEHKSALLVLASTA